LGHEIGSLILVDLGCFFDLFSMRLFCFHDLGHKFVVLTWIDS